jgi:hypothetical protein
MTRLQFLMIPRTSRKEIEKMLYIGGDTVVNKPGGSPCFLLVGSFFYSQIFYLHGACP